MWGDTEEEEEEAGAILMIFNCQGSNVEDQGLQHPEAPTPALTPPPPSTTPGLVGMGRSWEEEGPGEAERVRQQGLEVFYFIYLFLVLGVVVFRDLSLTYNTRSALEI